MTVHTGKHFLQIPGPSNVPDRVLRAMDMPTLDHRGPEFAQLGLEVLEGCKAQESGRDLSLVRNGRVGGGDREYALAPR